LLGVLLWWKSAISAWRRSTTPIAIDGWGVSEAAVEIVARRTWVWLSLPSERRWASVIAKRSGWRRPAEARLLLLRGHAATHLLLLRRHHLRRWLLIRRYGGLLLLLGRHLCEALGRWSRRLSLFSTTDFVILPKIPVCDIIEVEVRMSLSEAIDCRFCRRIVSKLVLWR
jgi:hypothetical protein